MNKINILDMIISKYRIDHGDNECCGMLANCGCSINDLRELGFNDDNIKWAIDNEYVSYETIHEYQCVVDKYIVMTDEKYESLGNEMKLKELLDLYWNGIRVYDETRNKYICFCYKGSISGYEFYFDDSKLDDDKNKINELLSYDVVVSDDYDLDDDGYPTISCYLKK